jgi:hypothetical protein
MRLHRIMQLGPALRAYPGATHTRASHSIGVYHLCRRLLIHLTGQGADGWLSAGGVFSFLCAGLLHDAGHFPYAHSLKELSLEEHETLTAKIILSEPVKSLVAATGADPALSAAIVDKNLPGRGTELLFYRKLLSGCLDPDKLDYLNRDAQYCGVPYGAQDVDFILSRLHPHAERGVDIDSRGIPSVESILFSKYLMYRTVYWHRAVRSATAMVKKALLCGLESGLVAGEELYDLDDQGLFSLAERRGAGTGGSAFSLVKAVREGRLFTAAAEFPFDEKSQGPLLDIRGRSRLEESLAGELSASLGKPISGGELIIDVPEPVSFETGLFVADEGRSFAGSSSSFKPELVETFVKSLRIVRIFIDPLHEVEGKIPEENKTGQKILNITRKWIQLL